MRERQFSCETCLFYALRPAQRQTTARGQTVGQCRAHAPVLVADPTSGKPMSLWPIVYADQYCGDHATLEGEA